MNPCHYTILGEGACDGDSGGPLVFTSSTKNKQLQHYLIGVASWAMKNLTTGACEYGVPNVFTRVSKYLDFIKNNMEGDLPTECMDLNIPPGSCSCCNL